MLPQLSDFKIEVDTWLSDRRVISVRERLAERHGLPRSVTMDNGPGFANQALDELAFSKELPLSFIPPGNPSQRPNEPLVPALPRFFADRVGIEILRFAQGLPEQLDVIRIVNDSTHQGIGYSFVIQGVVPDIHRHLTGNEKLTRT